MITAEIYVKDDLKSHQSIYIIPLCIEYHCIIYENNIYNYDLRHLFQ